jgi:hypothetical protein
MSEVSEEAPPRGAVPTTNVFRLSFPTLRVLVLALLVCVAAPSALIATHIHENPHLSPIDEAAQFDYVSRIANGSMPRLGQLLLPDTFKLISCTGTALQGLETPPCPGSKHVKDYAGGGYQYEAQQPPTYYAVTVPLRWVGVHVFGMKSLTAARLTGALWVSAGMLLLWMAAALLGVSIKRRIPGILILVSAPVVLYQTSIVSNEAPGVFAGSLIAFLGVLAWVRPGRWTKPALGAAAFFVATLKLDDVLPVVVVAGVLACASWSKIAPHGGVSRNDVRAWFRLWWPCGGMLLLGAAVSSLAWIIIDNRLDLIDPRTLPTFDVLRGTPVSLSLLAKEAISMLNPLGGAYFSFHTNATGLDVGPALSLNLQHITATASEYLLLGAGLAIAFVRRKTWAHWTGFLSLVVLYVGGIVLGIGIWLTYRCDPALSSRYGLAIAPLLVLALVALVRGRWVLASLWAYAVSVFALAFVFMIVT